MKTIDKRFLSRMVQGALVALVLLFLFGCGSIPVDINANAPVYRLDLYGTLDDAEWEGIAVGSAAKNHTIEINSKTDVNLMRIISCHRFESFPDAIETGWFQKNRGFEYEYNQAPGIEDTGFCVLRLQAFTKEIKSDGSPVGSAYGVMLFHNDKFTLPGENICNGADGGTAGTSICQSMNGLIQQLRFREMVISSDKPPEGTGVPQPCEGKFIDAYTWQYKMPVGECVVIFASVSKPHKYYVHLSYGFNADQYRGK